MNAIAQAVASALPAVRAGAEVLQAVHDFIGRFVAYPSEHAHVAHTLWIAHAWLMDKWDTTPRLAFLSPEPGSGKSRALEVTAPLVPRPVIAVNTSPAYLFRKVADPEGAPTLLYDEIDTVFGPKAKENEETRGLLNAGYRKGAVAGRCVVRGKEVFTEELPAYSAVALAGLGGLPDTILTRSVVVRMRRRAPGERVEPWRLRIHEGEARAIANDLEAWCASVAERIEWPELPDGLEDRNADVWEALLAVADVAGGDWPRLGRVAAVTLVTESMESTPSLGVLLLNDLRQLFGDTPFMRTEAILEGLIAMDESPWGDLRGQPLNARGLSKRLRDYGVHPDRVRDGARIIRGYRRADLADAWSRYLPPASDGSVTSVTSVTGQTGCDVSVPDVTDVTDTPARGRPDDGPETRAIRAHLLTVAA